MISFYHLQTAATPKRSHGFNWNSATTQNRGINLWKQATAAHLHHGVGEEILLTVVKREMYVCAFVPWGAGGG